MTLVPIVLAFPVLVSLSGSGTSASLSGATIDPQWGQREERTEGFRSLYAKYRLLRVAELQKTTREREKIENLRTQCADALRRANRDSRFPTLRSCIRSQLLLEQNALLRERGTSIPGGSGVTQASKEAAIDALTSAMTATIDAIDADVFSGSDSLLTARENLRVRYRLPYWHARAVERSQQLLTALSHVLVKIHALQQTETTSALDEAVRCFSTIENRVENVLRLDDTIKINEEISQARTDALVCGETGKSLVE